MKKITTAAIVGTLAVVGALTAVAWNDQNATETATYASTHPVVTPTPVETTVTTEVTPAICTTALTDADTVIATAGEGFGILGEAMDAASNLDADGITAANVKMDALNKQLTAALATYKTSRDACKAAN
ncbi:hypothetical protein ACFPJ1_40485 [Kribbella qitaiheensis]|uniref:hypothetical protein n=1 Tax=Kribbella qitaiheensis TaxID=1544730 RepID=UPI0036169864